MKKFKDVLKTVAAKHNTTTKNVLHEIQAVIDAAYDNPDPQVRAQWRCIPHKAERPTPEEVVDYLTLRVRASKDITRN